MLSEYFFDFEVLPEWWCCVVGKYPKDEILTEEIKKDFLVFTSDDTIVREKLLACLSDKNKVNFGYNCKYYDNIILNAVANGFNTRQIKILNDIIIDPEIQYETQEHYRIAPFARKKYQNFIYQDMFDDNTGSLKEKEACLQLDIRESTIPFNKKNLTQAEKDELISYCKHDNWAGMHFYRDILKGYVNSKLILCKVFGLDIETAYKATNATLVGKILGATRKSYADNTKETIIIPKSIKQYIEYALPKNVIDFIVNMKVYSKSVTDKKLTVELFKNKVEFANGGIHSIPCNNLQVIANEEMCLANIDASSFYPAIMIYFNLLSRSVTKQDLFKLIYETRIKVKNKQFDQIDEAFKKLINDGMITYKELVNAFKLVMNTTFGASGNKYLDLYDPYMTTNVCRIGQLLLASLANNLYTQVEGLQVVQTNTDGVLVYFPRNKMDSVKQICNVFTETTEILLEVEEEYKTWQRDVNNYVLYDKDGGEKSKGAAFVSVICQPGRYRIHPLNAFVCREAIKNYLSKGEDIVEHIYNETDISKFVVTCHKGSFSGIVRGFNDGKPDEILHKVNRVYASLDKSLGMIYKTKVLNGEQKRYKSPGCPPHCELINESLSKYNINELRDKIDYMWYIEETIAQLEEQWYEMRKDGIFPIKILNI